MQIDKLLYNIDQRPDLEAWIGYIKSLPQTTLDEVKNEMIDRVDKFDPDDSQSIEQIRAAFKLYEYLMKNKVFCEMTFNDGSFICSLAFYLSAQKQNQHLVRALEMISHQYLTLEQKAYSQSINLFKALLEIYESIDEKFYEKLTDLMLHMVMENLDLLSVINHKYYFLQCLIQIVNQEQKIDKLAQIFGKVRKLYSTKNYLLFHQIDFKILVDILLRTLINQHENQIISETLKLYLILSENSVLQKDKYRVEEFHSALKEKLTYINKEDLDENLQKIINQIFDSQ